MEKQISKLLDTLLIFNIKSKLINKIEGLNVIRLELKINEYTKISEINSILENICVALGTKNIKLEAPVEGKKDIIAFEIPKENSEILKFDEILLENKYKDLKIPLGKDIYNNTVYADISEMPHLLIAGTTGSGKSVFLNTIIMNLLYKNKPDNLKFIMIDPKMVELMPYNDLDEYLIDKVITQPETALNALKYSVNLMEERYLLLSSKKVRNIKKYNEISEDKLPFIIIIIDELADLMMISPKETELNICRIAQKARAVGIHLIVATQRPSADVITGLIKSNLPSRIALSVKSKIDSRIILDENGAEKLLGKGDMLFSLIGSNKLIRIQSAFIPDEEINILIKRLKKPEIKEINYLNYKIINLINKLEYFSPKLLQNNIFEIKNNKIIKFDIEKYKEFFYKLIKDKKIKIVNNKNLICRKEEEKIVF